MFRKNKEIKSQPKILNEDQETLLKKLIGPIKFTENKENTSFEELLKKSGEYIQIILKDNSMNFGEKKFYLDCAINHDKKNFYSLVDDSEIKLMVKTTLKKINNFCLDNAIQWRVNPNVSDSKLQKGKTSQYFLWPSSSLSYLKNKDEPFKEMSDDEKNIAEKFSTAMRSKSKKMIAKTSLFIGKIDLLYTAVKTGNDLLVKEALSQYDFNPNLVPIHEMRPLYLAVHEGYHNVVDTLLEAKSNPNQTKSDRIPPIHCAAEKNYAVIVTALLNAKAHLDGQIADENPLFIASQEGYDETVIALLEAKANPDLVRKKDGFTPLHVATYNKHNSVVIALIKASAKVDIATNHGFTALDYAADRGSSDIIRSLLKARSNPNTRSEKTMQTTPLYIAASNGYHDVTTILLEAKADHAVSKTDDGASPLYIAAQGGHIDVLAELLKAGANPNMARTNGSAPIHIAAEKGFYPIVRALLDAKANPNVIIKPDRITPLYLAAKQGHSSVVTALLEAKANPFITTIHGETPIYIAIKNDHQEVAGLLDTTNKPSRLRL